VKGHKERQEKRIFTLRSWRLGAKVLLSDLRVLRDLRGERRQIVNIFNSLDCRLEVTISWRIFTAGVELSSALRYGLPRTGGTPMSDNNENVLAVLRLLLAAFLVLILVIAVNLVLVIARANAATITIRGGYQQLNGAQAPLWNIPANQGGSTCIES
jgi:hypothetical protein